jgi:hypothetical protein
MDVSGVVWLDAGGLEGVEKVGAITRGCVPVRGRPQTVDAGTVPVLLVQPVVAASLLGSRSGRRVTIVGGMVADPGGPVACVGRGDQVGQPLVPWLRAQVVVGRTFGCLMVACVRSPVMVDARQAS